MSDEGIDVTAKRTPSELRNLLEVRVRRQAVTYSPEQRRAALVELRELADAAIEHLDAEG